MRQNEGIPDAGNPERGSGGTDEPDGPGGLGRGERHLLERLEALSAHHLFPEASAGERRGGTAMKKLLLGLGMLLSGTVGFTGCLYGTDWRWLYGKPAGTADFPA